MKLSAQCPSLFAFVLLLPIILFFGCSKKIEAPSTADTIVLKNGGKIQCEIVREDEKKVTVQYQGGVVEFTRAEIQTILHDQQQITMSIYGLCNTTNIHVRCHAMGEFSTTENPLITKRKFPHANSLPIQLLLTVWCNF